ncbi:sulfatase [Niabella insulamsoli]|uniref:sulfatase family protein n=1 Tax=Niabella insulamsoli TaxID=3144874 RepID=UPI0031FC758D
MNKIQNFTRYIVRRCTIRRSVATVFSLLLVCIAHAQSKPNIVLFIADDLNQTDLGCYGNTDVKTPHLDKLAGEGMRFTRAYAASSMCSPSRSVIFTGLYPFKNGSQMNHFTTHAGIKSLPHFLKAQGYRVVIAGKTHVTPEENFPFEHIGKEFGQYQPIANRLDRKKETVHMIEDHFKTRPDQPICLIVAPWVPHVPWFPNRDFNPQQLKLPDYLADTKETRNALAAYYQSIGEADKMFGTVVAALDRAKKSDNTVVMFTSDQGAQFPSAKWTVYDRGLRVPLIIKWPGKIAAGTTSGALVSLADLTPTMVDLAGGDAIEGLDGASLKDVLTGRKAQHHSFVFAETSVEPHYWYNYTPARSVITQSGWHYIKNYHPGLRFITHIDEVERNEFYFDSWVKDAATNARTKFLLDRYSYRPPEELFNLNTDPAEFKNLVSEAAFANQLQSTRALLGKELARQGESEIDIIKGTLPVFYDKNYTIDQGKAASAMSFNRSLWNPDTLYITAYLTQTDRGGIVCDYFNNFQLSAFDGKISFRLHQNDIATSRPLAQNAGHLLLKLTAQGALSIYFNHELVLSKNMNKDLTKIKGGYVTCGMLEGKSLSGALQTYKGSIEDLRFTMNQLLRSP